MMLLEDNWVGLPLEVSKPERRSPFPVHVISLSGSTARRASIAHQMEKAGLAFSFLDAVDGRSLPADGHARVSPLARVLKGYDFTPGQIGCWLSHRIAWEKVAEADGQVALVLEDDAILAPGFAEAIARIEAETRDFELVQLSYTNEPRRGFAALRSVGARRIGRIAGKSNGGGAYLVRSEGARKLLSISAMAFCNDDWGWYEALTGLERCGVMPPLADNPRTQSVIAEIDGASGSSSRQRRKKGRLARAHKLLLWPVLSRLQHAAIALRQRPHAA